MKKILGLDLGTTSIGWAFVKESSDPNIPSTIEKIGVRVNPLTTDEQTNFENGKSVSVNADRTNKRSARRNLQRYKLRRSNLINALLKAGIINNETILAEVEKKSTHQTYYLRAKAVHEQITKEEFARVLLMLNKKRGYKSSRKAKNEDEGYAIDGMAIAKKLYEENLTPGQLSYQLLLEGKKKLPDYYRSDLLIELDKIWQFQKQFHSEILTDTFRKKIDGKGQRATILLFKNEYQLNTAEIKGTKEEKKLKAYEWRSKAISTQLSKEELAYVITEINNNINNSSGYLGEISDRSKELYFKKQTVGEYLYAQLRNNFHTKLKNQVFYRQDYLDEFEKIWETQARFHQELTPALKTEIRDIIIFYQRKLKSQKSLVSFCEFESKTIEIEIDGKKKKITTGYKVCPKSSPLFQEFKIWQNLNSIVLENKETKKELVLNEEQKQLLFNELNIKGNLKKEEILTLIGLKIKDWQIYFNTIEGNRTNQELFKAYLKMMDIEDPENSISNYTAEELIENVTSFFESYGINKSVLQFNAELDGKAFEQQASFQLWHILYSYQEDNSISGNETLYKTLQRKFGFNIEQAKILANISLPNDYGSLSTKAIKKIYPYIKENKYSDACKLAGYNHSSSLTKEENEKRILKDKLELLPKNSLRNPVVEKILNQMVNVVNAIIQDPQLGKPDEIRIELARELKKSAEERAEMTSAINKATAEHKEIREILIKKDGIKNPTRNDIIKYKLYKELKNNGYKTLYSDTYIPREDLFKKEFDIEHIIPKSILFDDSFSNKTLCKRDENLKKGENTAIEFVEKEFSKEMVEEYKKRVLRLYELNQKNKGEGISKAKYKKLLMYATDIGEGFIERDLRNSQYIAKKAKQMLQEICRTVVSTSGSITDKLREDWNLVNVMQELNFEKYKKLGLTEIIEKKDGGTKEKIKDWSKRNDHRHHAIDALTVAFTKHSHIQYLNNLHARKKDDKLGREIYGIEQKETEVITDANGSKKRKFKEPIPNFRQVAKEHLENILVSYKAKNKVVTKNKNKIKTKKGEKIKIELTPRGQLHKETVYGKLKQYVTKEEKISAKFDENTILKVANTKERIALLKRLKAFDNDPKKAFTGKNSVDKNPVYLDELKTKKINDKVKLVAFEEDYTIRKEINPDNFKDVKNIEKVIDIGIRKKLIERLNQYNGNAKEAFANLEKNPIWLNEEKKIAIKTVTISGIKNAEALHYKKDHLGKYITDNNGNKIPTDFVSTGNNHHVAIYKDVNGNLQEKVVSFYEAVARVNQQLPVIDKSYNANLGWQFLFTMKQNEMFVFANEETGFNPYEIDLLNEKNYKLISPNLFRVQKISTGDYWFRHHLETSVEVKPPLKDIAYKRCSLHSIKSIIKVQINHLGKIVKVGEY